MSFNLSEKKIPDLTVSGIPLLLKPSDPPYQLPRLLSLKKSPLSVLKPYFFMSPYPKFALGVFEANEKTDNLKSLLNLLNSNSPS